MASSSRWTLDRILMLVGAIFGPDSEGYQILAEMVFKARQLQKPGDETDVVVSYTTRGKRFVLEGKVRREL